MSQAALSTVYSDKSGAGLHINPKKSLKLSVIQTYIRNNTYVINKLCKKYIKC